MNRYFNLFLFCVILFSSCQQKLENPLETLAEEDIHSLNLFFYPSTIRMINVAGDSSFNNATKDIERIQFMSVDISDSLNYAVFEAWESLQNYDQWDELMNANMGGSKVLVLAPKASDRQVFAKVKDDNTVYLLLANGQVNLSEAMKVMNGGLDLGPVNSFLNNKNKEEQRREVWKTARAEQKRLEVEDSMKVANSKKKIIE